MNYPIQLSRAAIRVLDRMDRVMEQRMRARLHQLREAPEDSRLSKLLVGAGGIRAARVGDWQILFVVDHIRADVLVVAIRPRRQAYRL